jgi:membrane-associated phospholipid phosphatase
MEKLKHKTNPFSDRLNIAHRLSLIICVIVLHSVCYYLVNSINSTRPEDAFYDFTIFIDNWIPYMSWTWVIYYFGDIYIVLGAGIIVWYLPNKKFIRAVSVYSGMIVIGALIQLLLPAVAPWPNHLIPEHQFFHDLISMKPYANFPSMHVALALLPALMLFSVTKNRWIRILSTAAVILISITTVTLKEHFVLDVFSGAALAFVSYLIWKRDFKIFAKESSEVLRHEH